jgi:predicted amidohydrolase YtcJ
MGTDHRWRLEHVGAGRKQHFERAAELGVTVSMGPFQFYYWGDVLDGGMFESEHGSQWQAFNDAFNTSKPCYPAFHNDGMVSPPSPMINIQTAASRTTKNGNVHGINQAVTLEQAFMGETTHAAYLLGLDKDVGSVEVGKLADFCVLSSDPWQLKDMSKLEQEVKVLGTYISGKKVDAEAFCQANPGQYVPSEHDFVASPFHNHCCSMPRRPRAN